MESRTQASHRVRVTKKTGRKRGLGSPNMSPDVKKAIARAGGKAVQRKGTGHRFTPESGAKAADIARLNTLRKRAGTPFKRS